MKNIILTVCSLISLQSFAQTVNQFVATPNPIIVPAGETLGVTNVSWNVSGVSWVEVHVISPTGPLFAAGGGIGQATTGKWVTNGMPIFLVNSANGAVLAGLTVSVISESSPKVDRTILQSADVSDPNGMFFTDHEASPADRWGLKVRYQRPNPYDYYSSPVRYQSFMNTIGNTGMGPLAPMFQRGPINGYGDQSTYQIKGTEVGVLMRSWDSPHPRTLPACQPNCSGYQKHSVYEYKFSTAQPIFSAVNPNRALEISGEFQALQMEQWSSVTGGSPQGLLAGQYAMVLFLEDPNGKLIQYVIFIYDSNPITGSFNEGIHLEVIGAGDNGYFVNSSFKKDRPMQFTTVDASSYAASNSTWSGFRPMKLRITPQNLANVINEMNARGGSLSTNVYGYKVRQFGVNTEVYYENNGDHWVFGTSLRNLKLKEVEP